MFCGDFRFGTVCAGCPEKGNVRMKTIKMIKWAVLVLVAGIAVASVEIAKNYNRCECVRCWFFSEGK